MIISINQITSGIVLKVEGELYFVVEYSHVKPAKGSAFVRVRMKNMKTDLVLERTYRTAERLEEVPMEERKLQFSYKDGGEYHFIEQDTFEDVVVSKAQLGNAANFLQDNLHLAGVFCEHKLQKITLPNFIITQVKETEPGYKGDSSKAGTKAAVIDTGATIQVPLFISVDDWIKIDTRSEQYTERVQK